MRVPFWKKREKDEILSRNEKRRGSVCIVYYKIENPIDKNFMIFKTWIGD